MSLPIPASIEWQDGDELTASRRMWSAVMLATTPEVCGSILLGRPVLARQLDQIALKRALRGERLPSPENYFRVRVGHLDAIAECGSMETRG